MFAIPITQTGRCRRLRRSRRSSRCSWGAEASLAAIRARTLIIQGDGDYFLPLEVPLDLYRKIPKAQLWVIPNATHSSVFYLDFAPAGTDLGGTSLAARIFPEVVNSFLAVRVP